jgi:hypothetical protein
MYNDGGSSGGSVGNSRSRTGRRSNKSLEAALAPIDTNSELDRKITLATECFTTTKASELILKDRLLAAHYLSLLQMLHVQIAR